MSTLPPRPYLRWALQTAAVILAALAARYGIPVSPPLFKGHERSEGVALPQPPQHAALFLCSNAAPSIEGPSEAEPHTLVRLRAVNVDPKAALLWRVHPNADRATNPKGVLEFTGKPGAYEIDLLVITSKDGELDIVEARHRVTIKGPSPPAPPPTKADPAAATGRITFGNAGCTATVIHPRRADGRWDILTAAHCAGPGARGRIALKDGRTLAVTVTARDAGPDLCWLATDDPVESLPYAELADDIPDPGTAVWHNGFGIDNPGNREDGVVTGKTSDGQLQMTLSVSSGDSGGGIFRASDGKLVAAVCCTTNKGAKVTMYGGHATLAARLRPRSPAADEFVPAALRERPFLELPFPDWTPVR